jgi:hypothetical protein
LKRSNDDHESLDARALRDQFEHSLAVLIWRISAHPRRQEGHGSRRFGENGLARAAFSPSEQHRLVPMLGGS